MRLIEQAQEAVRQALKPGALAIDATAGNGHDTLFLSNQVGPDGRVFCCDIQTEALSRTAALLAAATNVTYLLIDHADLANTVPAEYHGRVAAVMFNLGYLPGGDRSLITRPDSTIPAIHAGLELLRPGGVMTILAYTGHPGGSEEAEAVRAALRGLSDRSFALREIPGDPESPAAPCLFVVHKASSSR
jgi:predicted methyltransferase